MDSWMWLQWQCASVTADRSISNSVNKPHRPAYSTETPICFKLYRMLTCFQDIYFLLQAVKGTRIYDVAFHRCHIHRCVKESGCPSSLKFHFTDYSITDMRISMPQQCYIPTIPAFILMNNGTVFKIRFSFMVTMSSFPRAHVCMLNMYRCLVTSSQWAFCGSGL